MDALAKRAYSAIKGQQDPRYADTPTVTSNVRDELGFMKSNFGINRPVLDQMAGASLMGTSDEGMANVVAKSLGDRFIRIDKDANGYPLVVYKNQNGEPTTAYINKPGLDVQDVTRFAEGSVPYALTGGMAGAVTKGAGLATRMAGQAATAGTTSLVGDAGAANLGSKQGLDWSKAAMMMLGGAGGEAVGTAGRKILTALQKRKFIDKGVLTDAGRKAMAKNGLDPAKYTDDIKRMWADEIAGAADPAAVTRKVHSKSLGIDRTRAESTLRPDDIAFEQLAREGKLGVDAMEATNKALGKEGMAARMETVGARMKGDLKLPQTAKSNAGEKVKTILKQGWKKERGTEKML